MVTPVLMTSSKVINVINTANGLGADVSDITSVWGKTIPPTELCWQQLYNEHVVNNDSQRKFETMEGVLDADIIHKTWFFFDLLLFIWNPRKIASSFVNLTDFFCLYTHHTILRVQGINCSYYPSYYESKRQSYAICHYIFLHCRIHTTFSSSFFCISVL